MKFTKERRKFTADYLADISKAIFAVALASKFFGDLPVIARVILTGTAIVALIAALIMLPKGDSHV